jgi:formate dehydrogenase subunit beta
MAKTAKINVNDGDLLASIQELLQSILRLEDISAVLVPQHLPMKNVVMPTLVTDPDQLDGVDPLAPVFPMTSAKLVSRLTRKPMGGKVVAVMRSCELRAFIELVKLKQGSMDELVVLGIDCMGTYKTDDYLSLVGDNGKGTTVKFYKNVLSGGTTTLDGIDLTSTCKACEHPVNTSADINIGLFGVDTDSHMLVQAQTPEGENLLNSLGLSGADQPPGRKDAIATLVSERTAFRDKMFEETAEKTNSLDKLTHYLASCINCYNCRVACPVCYCKECVFVTDVFNHEPSQYLRWANRKGILKMPTDTVFYHITRLAHMSTACIGCGQCSNACPNDIPVMELFRSVSYGTQKAFEYEAGRSIEDEPPLSVFREDELTDVVGIGKR